MRTDPRSTRASAAPRWCATRSEEHTSELQSQSNLVCRLLLEKKNNRHERRSAVMRNVNERLRAEIGRDRLCDRGHSGGWLRRDAVASVERCTFGHIVDHIYI